MGHVLSGLGPVPMSRFLRDQGDHAGREIVLLGVGGDEPIALCADENLIRRVRVPAIARAGLHFESLHFTEHVVLKATSDVSAVRDADWVLFSVKSGDTEDAAQLLAQVLKVRLYFGELFIQIGVFDSHSCCVS